MVSAHQPERSSAPGMFILCSALLLMCGCGKKEAPLAEAPPPLPNGQPAEPAPQKMAPAPQDPAGVAALIAELTQTVRRFGMEQRRPPKDLQELVTQGYLPALPKAPAGKKFAINRNLEVYLAD